ncbi:MAG: DNA repair protein RecO [Actinomycetota bacterium]
MSRYHRTKGIVLRTYKLGEADRIIVLLSPDRGMIRGVAKGIRKTKSKFGSRLEQTSHVALQIHEGKSELHLITQVETIDYFPKIRQDLSRLTKAAAMLEAVDQVALPGEPAEEMHQMLLRALQSLEQKSSPLMVPSFFLKLMALEGSNPHVAHCVNCSDPNVVSYSATEGGLLCQNHRKGILVSEQAVSLLQNILGGELGKALNAPESNATKEVENLATQAIEHFLERRMRATKMLNT